VSGGIQFQKPGLPSSESIERYLAVSRASHRFSNYGPCWQLLRDRLTEATGRPCVPVSSGTLGLMVAIAVLRRRGANEALMPSFAFPAAAQAAVWNGLHPVFADVDAENWHLELGAVTDATAIVIALSAFGVPPPAHVRSRWEAICRETGVPLLVDSAAGFGGRGDDGTRVGAQGDAEVVSFGAVKPLTAAEGGAIFFREAAAAAEAERLIHFALDEGGLVTRADGLNAMLSEPAAATALASLDGLQSDLEVRREIATELLGRLPEGFQRQAGDEYGTWQFVQVAAADGETRDAVLAETGRREIELRTYYRPLHEMPAFAQFVTTSELVRTESLGSRILNLPLASDFGAAEIAAIAHGVRAGSSALIA
jgi:dTDP-4-amino-4,6-dideoxygalactose transaminase